MCYKQNKFEQDMHVRKTQHLLPWKSCVSSLALVIRCENRILFALYCSVLSIVVCLAVPCFPPLSNKRHDFRKRLFSCTTFV
jgi:hypothetical protein